MTKRSTKRALALSFVSLLLCVSMFVGTTFAWFTDSVSSTNNIITAGNLDVELEYYNGTEWKAVGEKTNVFEENTLWEPGHTEVVYLKVSNIGTLALKYQLAVNVASETVGINVDDEVFKLSDYIYFGVVETADEKFYENREDAIDALETVKKLNAGYSKSSKLEEKGDVEYVALVVYMPTTVGNEANYKTGTNPPVINLGINLFATQYTHEEDSFGKDYDKDAAWTGAVDTTWYNTTDTTFTLTTAEELAGLAELVNGGNTFAGKTVKLGANVDLNNVNWTPIGTKSAEGEKAFTRTFAGSFDGQGHTISNLRVVGGNALGLFGRTGTGTHIENVNIVNAYVSGTDYVGAIAGYAYLSANCIKNCTVTNATIIATPFLLANGEYDGGAKAGVIVGYALNGNLVGNTAKDSTVIAYRDLGGIAGMLNADGIKDRTLTAEGNIVKNVTLSYTAVAGAYADNKKNENMNDIVGRIGSKSSVGANTVDGIIKDDGKKGVTLITNLEELLAFVKSVNVDGVTYAGKTVMLGADIDLANMEWTPIGTGAGFFGTFDGNGKTISNLKVTGNKSTVGLFANTYNGEIKNLTVENATVSGYLNVGVVAGNPYTSKYTNITVKGHVEVNGMSYVGGVGGKNAYANWTNITVDVDDTSYVKAISTEDGIAYRTYVGGVVGFNGEGGHTFKNITSNIDVIGDVCDIGGVFGIAHYNNKFENITCTGDVTNLISAENDGADAATDVLETGLIAGVWHNQNGTTVSFTNISATGTISTPNVTPAEAFHNGGLVGKKYSASGTGTLEIVNFYEKDGITYYTDVVTGDNVLYLVPADYTGSTVNVAEGTTAIGNYAFAYNSNVKTVILASTVRDLGQGFNESTVEKVVLNEGLTTISSRAFKSTTALKEVVISSTVTEIADNAFQKSGIKEIVIPANVKTVGETAFGASLIEKVTFEGDIAIQGYAFRGCTKLHTVVMNGYNVTFVKSTLNGRNSMWFCNGESNNPNTSNITFYVKTEVIKERVLTAMGAERNNTPVVCELSPEEDGYYLVDGKALAYDAQGLVAALEDGKDVVLTGDVKIEPAGMSNAYGTTGINIKNGQTIDGNGGILDIKGAGGTWDSGINTTGGVIKNLTVTGSFRGIFINHNSTHSETVVLENVIIDGTTYTISCDQGMNQGLEATNCTFNGWTSYAATLGHAKFVDCSFGRGNGYAYCRPYAPTEFVGCDFEAGFRVDARAAVTFKNCYLDGVLITAENVATLVTNNGANATVVND